MLPVHHDGLPMASAIIFLYAFDASTTGRYQELPLSFCDYKSPPCLCLLFGNFQYAAGWYWATTENWVTTGWQQFLDCSHCPTRLNSTQLPVELSWVESGRAVWTGLYSLAQDVETFPPWSVCLGQLRRHRWLSANNCSIHVVPESSIKACHLKGNATQHEHGNCILIL